MGFHVVGIDLQRLLVMGDGFVHAALFEQGVAEVVLGFHVVGIDLQRLLEMGDRFVHLALLNRALPRLFSFQHFRLICNGLMVLFDRLFHVPLF